MRSKSEIKADIREALNRLETLEVELESVDRGYGVGDVLVRDGESYQIIGMGDDGCVGFYTNPAYALTHQELSYRWKKQ